MANIFNFQSYSLRAGETIQTFNANSLKSHRATITLSAADMDNPLTNIWLAFEKKIRGEWYHILSFQFLGEIGQSQIRSAFLPELPPSILSGQCRARIVSELQHIVDIQLDDF